MKNKISQKLINSLKPQDKSYRVHDVTQPGLFIRVLPSGHMSYMVTWGRNKNATLGRVGILTLEQARKEAAKYLAEAREYGEPLAIADIRKNTVIPTLECFIDESYDPWVKIHHSDAVNVIRALKTSFNTLLPLRLDEVTIK